ncbi:MAG: DUF2497 domain-containing protein [Pseudomonadota bacterium]
MASAQPEPSMEEILASIRRIISEDDVPTDELDTDSVDEPLPDGPEAPQTQSVDTDQSTAAASEREFVPGNVSTGPKGSEGLKQEASVPSAAPQLGGVSSTAAGNKTKPSANTKDERPTFVENARPVAHMEAPQMSSEKATTSENLSVVPDATPAIETVSFDADSQSTSPVADSFGDALIADATAGVAGEAFKNLARSIRVSSEGEKTLEDIVTDLLRPLIKQWLDQHLASIVEEKVGEEVERIARRAR